MEPPDQIPEVQETSGGTEASPEIPAAPQTGDHPGTPFQNPAYGGRVLLVAGGLLLLILLISTGVFFLQDQHTPDAGQAVTPVPSQTTAIQITPTVTGTTATVPVNGTWVRILSPGSFIGQAGNPDSLAEVAGSGERWFRVRDSTGLVRVTVEKQDYSGNELRVQIYSEGRLVFSRSTSAPQGTVDLLIDPATGEAPGMRETPGTTSTGRGIQYL
jgi:hypothetical protein